MEPLSRDEFRNRVRAAAALRGLGMRALRDYLEQKGVDRTQAETLVKDPAARRPKQMRDLCEALELPRAWFTDPDWRNLIPGSGADALAPAFDPDLPELEKDLEDDARRSESSGSRSEEQEPEVQNE